MQSAPKTNAVEEETALRESEEGYRLLTENAISAVASHEIIFDETGAPIDYKFLTANAAFERQTGLKVKDIIGKRVTEVIQGINKTGLIEIYANVVITGKSISFEQHIKPLDRHYLINAYKLKGNCFACVFVDITERKKNEALLEEREAFLNLLFETIPIPIFYKNTSCAYEKVNKAFERCLWKNKEEIIGKTALDINPTDIAKADHEEDLKLLKNSGNCAYYTKTFDSLGIIHDIIVHKAALVDKNGKSQGIIGAILDMSDYNKIEEELDRTKLQLKEKLSKQQNKPKISKEDKKETC